MIDMIRSILTKLKMRLRGEIPTETYVKNGMRIGRNFHRLPNCILIFLIVGSFLLEIM